MSVSERLVWGRGGPLFGMSVINMTGHHRVRWCLALREFFLSIKLCLKRITPSLNFLCALLDNLTQIRLGCKIGIREVCCIIGGN